MNRAFFCLLFLLTGGLLCAQIAQTERFEIPIDPDENYEVISAGDNGLFLYQKVEKQSNGNTAVWKVLFIDTSFDIQWVKLYSLSSDFEIVDHYYNDGRGYLLFNNFSSKNRNLELISWDLIGNISRVPIRNYIPFSYFDFTATQDAVVIAGYFNYRPVVILYNFQDQIPRV